MTHHSVMDDTSISLPNLIKAGLRKAIFKVFPDVDPDVIQLQICANPKFGDYHCTSVMAIAKKRKLNPREYAQKVLDELDFSNIADEVQLAGPGFINIRLKQEAVKRALAKTAQQGDHFIQKTDQPRT